MKKITGVYSIIIGVSIIGLWIMLLATGNVPELETEPISIYFHLVAEIVMGALSLISGVALFRNLRWANPMFILSSGFVMYSVINSSGYYGNTNDWPMVIMFMAILVLSGIFTYKMLIEELSRGCEHFEREKDSISRM